jgi:hypothetical protein
MCPHRPICLPFVSISLRWLLRKAEHSAAHNQHAHLSAISRLLSCSSPLFPLHTTVALLWPILSHCSPTAMLANRARHPTLTIHPCWARPPYYTMLYSRLLSSITLSNTSSNKHHNSKLPPSQTKLLLINPSTDHRLGSLLNRTFTPARYHCLSCWLRHDYSDLHPTTALHIRNALPQDGIRLDGCLGQDLI